MESQNISIISIHPDSAQPLAFDLKDILTALGSHLEHWIWCVRHLDWLGDDDSEAICRKVEEAGPAGLWMDSQDLLYHARKVYQTIEGEFLAFPREVEPRTVRAEELNLRAFPASRAELAIVAVDGGFFDICAKDRDLLSPLRQFKDVREENASTYF